MGLLNKSVFNGFSPATLNFLRNLKANNNKLWFENNRQDYQTLLMKPLRNLVIDIGPFMLSIDPYFEVLPAINKTISRIYRDTRFSKDKTPYKTSMWINFNEYLWHIKT